MTSMNDDLISATNLEEAQQWGEAANKYLSAAKIESSLLHLEKAAWCFSRNEDFQRAIECLDVLADREPQKAKWPYMIGYQHYAQKNWTKAIEWFEKALQLKNDYFVVKYRLAYSYYQITGNYKQLTKAEYWKALGLLEECHALWKGFGDEKRKREKSTYFSVNFLHGKMLMNLDKHRDKAITLLENALKIDGNDEACKYNLAKAYYLAGEYEFAQKALPVSKQYYVIELNAYIHAKIGNYDIALSQISSLLQRRKKDYLYSFLAHVHLLRGEKYKALEAIKTALKLGGNNHKNHFVYAKVLHEFGLFKTALKEIDKAIQIKASRYDSAYTECEELRHDILRKMNDDYGEDENLLKKLLKTESGEDGENHGIIKNYNSNKGFGFISSENGDLFFHISKVNNSDIMVGDKVEYSIGSTPKGACAINVKKL